METSLSHLEILIAPGNLPFYRDLLGFLGWNTIYESDEVAGYQGSNNAGLWFVPRANDAVNDYDGKGMNHLAIGANSIADVDATVAYLGERGIAALFETPRHRADFAAAEGTTYYQVMFETPDRILVEVVYVGPV